MSVNAVGFSLPSLGVGVRSRQREREKWWERSARLGCEPAMATQLELPAGWWCFESIHGWGGGGDWRGRHEGAGH